MSDSSSDLALLDSLTSDLSPEEKAEAVLFKEDGEIVAYSATVAMEWNRKTVPPLIDDEPVPEPTPTAGATAGQTTGTTASQTAGATAGQTTGTTASQTAGATAGQTTGTTADQTTGATTGQTTGTTADQTTGATTGETTGATTGGGDRCADCTAGTAETMNQEPYGGTGPYRRIGVLTGLNVRGAKATISALGYTTGAAANSQPLAPFTVLEEQGEKRPYIYVSAHSGEGHAYDIGYQVGFTNPQTPKLNRFVTNEARWTWIQNSSTSFPLPSTSTIQVTVVQHEGNNILRYRSDSGTVFMQANGPVENRANWIDNDEQFNYISSIAFPRNNLVGYGIATGTTALNPALYPWYCGTRWSNRQVLIGGQWITLTSNHIRSIGNYPQPGQGLLGGPGGTPTGRTWHGTSSPIFVYDTNGIANETVTIDLLRTHPPQP